jgi:hypothetical protein
LELGALRELDVASRGCLEAGFFEAALDALGAGVAELPLDSPIVINMNSHNIPSSLYVICIGLDGCEYKALTIVFVTPAWVMIDLKSLTLMTMWSFSSTLNSPNSNVSIAIVVCKGCLRISVVTMSLEINRRRRIIYHFQT